MSEYQEKHEVRVDLNEKIKEHFTIFEKENFPLTKTTKV